MAVHLRELFMTIFNLFIALSLILTVAAIFSYIKFERIYNFRFSLGIKSSIFLFFCFIICIYLFDSILLSIFVLFFSYSILPVLSSIYLYFNTKKFFKKHQSSSSLFDLESQVIEKFLELNLKCIFIKYETLKDSSIKIGTGRHYLNVFKYTNNNGITFSMQLGDELISPFSKQADFFCSSNLDKKIIYQSENLYGKSFYIISDNKRLISVTHDEFESLGLHIDDYTEQSIDLLEMTKF